MSLTRVLVVTQLLVAAALTPVVIGALGLGGPGVIVAESHAEPKSLPKAEAPTVVAEAPAAKPATTPATEPECRKVRVVLQHGYGGAGGPRCAPATTTR